jgi:hypothetical protein
MTSQTGRKWVSYLLVEVITDLSSNECQASCQTQARCLCKLKAKSKYLLIFLDFELPTLALVLKRSIERNLQMASMELGERLAMFQLLKAVVKGTQFEDYFGAS